MAKARSNLKTPGLAAVAAILFAAAPVWGGFLDDLAGKATQTSQEAYETALRAT